MPAIRTVGVVGTGVIGASWTGLFLAHGLRVVVSDPASGSEKKLNKYLQNIWPDLKKIGLKSGASLDNYQFVGTSLKDHYSKVDFIQEVINVVPRYAGASSLLESCYRMRQRRLKSKRVCWPRLMQQHVLTS